LVIEARAPGRRRRGPARPRRPRRCAAASTFDADPTAVRPGRAPAFRRQSVRAICALGPTSLSSACWTGPADGDHARAPECPRAGASGSPERVAAGFGRTATCTEPRREPGRVDESVRVGKPFPGSGQSRFGRHCDIDPRVWPRRPRRAIRPWTRWLMIGSVRAAIPGANTVTNHARAGRRVFSCDTTGRRVLR
jgi:hypothetical protein